MAMTLRRSDTNRMAMAVVAVFLLAGCAGISMPRMGGGQFHESREIRGGKAEVFAACRQALEAMNYVYHSGSPGSGRLEMQGGLQPGGTAQALRQRQVRVAVTWQGGSNNEVSIGFWEYNEDVSLGGTVTASGKLVRGGVLYEAFWSTLDEYKPEVPEEDLSGVAVPDRP